jgi:hypothetical protein
MTNSHEVHLVVPSLTAESLSSTAGVEVPAAPLRVQSYPLTEQQREMLSCPGVTHIPGRAALDVKEDDRG